METVEQSAAVPDELKVRRPRVAGLLSLMCPGLGQLYIGQVWLGLIIVAVSWLGTLGIVVFFVVPLTTITWILTCAWSLSAAGHAWLYCRKLPRAKATFLTQWQGLLTVVIVFAVAAKLAGTMCSYKAFKFRSGGMENCIMAGDLVTASMSAYKTNGPARGDVILFSFPNDPRYGNCVERCVGLPGETIEIRDKLVYIDGSRYTEPTSVKFKSPMAEQMAAGGNSQDSSGSPRNFGPFVVPPNSYFVLGDNRDSSYDSREWGTVPSDLLRGQVVGLLRGVKLVRLRE